MYLMPFSFFQLFLGFFLIFPNFYWHLSALQFCISVYCTAQLMNYIHMYTYTPSFWISFPLVSPQSTEFPVLYSRFSIIFYFIHSINNVYIYVSIQVLQFIPFPRSHLLSICLFSTSVFSISVSTHSSILAWKSHGQRNLGATIHGVARVRHNSATKSQLPPHDL